MLALELVTLIFGRATEVLKGLLCMATPFLLGAGVLSSLIGGGDRSAGQKFAAAVWRSEGDVVAPDKGA